MVTIETSDLAGMAVRCECSLCGRYWTRPAGDPEAKTLVSWARRHDCSGQFVTLNTSLLPGAERTGRSPPPDRGDKERCGLLHKG